jgi:hypothetical protein
LLLLTVLITPWLARLRWAALLLPLALVVVAYPERDLSHDAGPRAAAEALLQAAPPHAVLLTPGDRTIFTLWYFQHVEGLRPDLRLVDANLFAFDWYRAGLGALYPDLLVPERDDLDALYHANGPLRSICTVRLLSADHTAAIQPALHCSEGTH